MTRTTAARLGGFTFLFYIAVGIGGAAIGVHGLARTLATGAQNGSAIVLALTLFIVTQSENRLLATLGMLLRLSEGLLGPITTVVGITLARPTLIDATLFAMGSLFFCWLLLRGRMIPAALAWIGVVASVILVVGLPLQLAGMLGRTSAQLMWMPMLAFEVPVGVWLIVKGVPPDAHARLQNIDSSPANDDAANARGGWPAGS